MSHIVFRSLAKLGGVNVGKLLNSVCACAVRFSATSVLLLPLSHEEAFASFFDASTVPLASSRIKL